MGIYELRSVSGRTALRAIDMIATQHPELRITYREAPVAE